MKKYSASLRRLLAVALMVCLIIPALQLTALASGGRKLTLMVYMTGSDLESDYGAATSDIYEMLYAHNDPRQVSVLVMIGGAEQWQGSFPSDRSVIYELVDGNPVEVWSADLMNMGDPATLTTLLNFGYGNYPAEDYALIMWDHGSGPLGGLCVDEVYLTDGYMDRLDMIELQTALKNSPCAYDPLEWIGFDACLMASVETAYICAPYAKYMIASQEVEPGTGWDYEFLRDIASDPSGAVTGIRIVDSYYESFAGREDRLSLTMACIDLRKIGGVESAMDNMFSQLDSVLDESSFSVISNRRRDTRAIGRASTGSEFDLIDLYHMTQMYYDQTPAAADELLNAIDAAVIYHRSNISDTNGLSVYYPYYNKDYFRYAWSYEYDRLGFSRGYSAYLDDYADIWLSESLSRWDGMRSTTLPPLPDTETDSTSLTMELTDDQVSNFAGAELYVLSQDQTLDMYTFTYSTNDVTLDGNTLSAAYNNTALYVLDSEGNPLTGSVEYHMVEDTYMVRAVLCQGDDTFDGDTLPVYIQFKLNEATGEMEVVGVIDLSNEDELTTGKQSVTLDSENWKSIYIAKYPVYLTRDENGDVLPYSEWEDSTWVFADQFSNEEEWTMKFVEENYITDDFATMFVVTDTQGNKYGSELTYIENKNIQEIALEPGLLTENEVFTASLTGAAYSTASYDPGLILYMDITNNTDVTLNIYAKDFIVDNGENRLVIDDSTTLCADLKPGDTVSTSLVIYSKVLNEHYITEFDGIDFKLQASDAEEYTYIDEYPVRIAQPIDISMLIDQGYTSAAPFSTPEDGKLNAELYGVEDNGDGTYSAWMRYVNNTDIDYDFYADSVLIGGHMLNNVFPHSVWVPAGTTLYAPVTISTVMNDSMYFYSLPMLEKPFDYWNIEVIDNIQIEIVTIGEPNEYLDVYLHEPIVLSGTEPTVHADVNLYSDSAITLVQRGNAFIHEDELSLLLVCENLLPETVTVNCYSGTLNGNPVSMGFISDIAPLSFSNMFGDNMPGNTGMRMLVRFYTSDMDPSQEISELSFTVSYSSPSDSFERVEIPVTIELPAGTTLESLMAE